MDNDNIQIWLRNIGSLIAGSLVTRGIIHSADVELVIGIIVAIGMVIYSQYKRRQSKAVKAATAAVALALPANSDTTDLNQALAEASLPPVAAVEKKL